MRTIFSLLLLVSILYMQNTVADAPVATQDVTITYRLDSSWGSGYQAAIIIANKSSDVLQKWKLSFSLPNQITSSWNAVQTSHSNTTYTFEAPSWQQNLAPGASFEIGFVASGVPTQPTNFVISQAITPSPTPTPTPTPTPQPTAAPAKPTVSVQQAWGDAQGSYDVNWSIYYGNKATSWQLFENNKLIYSASIASTDINTTQSATYRISNNTFGLFTYKIVVSNSYGSTSSDNVVYTAGSASKIAIDPADDTQQQLQITVNQGTNNFNVSMVGVNNPSFTVKTNNPSVLEATVSGTTLTIHAVQAGRGSVSITENGSGETRYVGIRVKTATGQIPKFPSYVALGSVSEDTPAHLTFWQSFAPGLRNKWVDIRYIYINGGPFIGWRTWTSMDGGRAISYIRNSKKLGFIPFFVYYNIPDGGESYYLDTQHIESQEYMEAYYKDLKFFLDIVRIYGGDETVGIVLEPDFIGYMMQNSNGTNPRPASQITAQTDAAYSSGVLDPSTDPLFPNTITGLVQSINYLIGKYAPHAIFGWQVNLWASPGITTPIPSNGLMHKTDTMGITAGRAAIASEAQVIAQYYLDAGIGSFGAHFVSVDKYGLDAGISSPQNPAQSTWFWNADHWNNYLLFVKTLHNTTQLPVVLWQLPVGHINTTLTQNPYTPGTPFPALNNTSQHYEDSAPVFFLGDDFQPGTSTRLSYFATNQGADPKISTTGSTVSWKQHITEAKNNGVIALLCGAGVGDSTNNVGNPPSDSYWWITKAQQYFSAPVPLL